jgi:hypothetical protein
LFGYEPLDRLGTVPAANLSAGTFRLPSDVLARGPCPLLRCEAKLGLSPLLVEIGYSAMGKAVAEGD